MEPRWDPRAFETPTGTLLTVCPSVRHGKLIKTARLLILIIRRPTALLLATCGCVATQFATGQDQQCSEPLADLQLPHCARARQAFAQKGFHTVWSSLSQGWPGAVACSKTSVAPVQIKALCPAAAGGIDQCCQTLSVCHLGLSRPFCCSCDACICSTSCCT